MAVLGIIHYAYNPTPGYYEQFTSRSALSKKHSFRSLVNSVVWNTPRNVISRSLRVGM